MPRFLTVPFQKKKKVCSVKPHWEDQHILFKLIKNVDCFVSIFYHSCFCTHLACGLLHDICLVTVKRQNAESGRLLIGANMVIFILHLVILVLIVNEYGKLVRLYLKYYNRRTFFCGNMPYQQSNFSSLICSICLSNRITSQFKILTDLILNGSFKIQGEILNRYIQK